MPLRSFDLCTPLFRLPRCQGKPASSELSSGRASVGSQPLWLSQLDHTELVQYFTIHPLPLRIPLRVIQAQARGPRVFCGGVCGAAGSGPVPGLSPAPGGPRRCPPPTAEPPPPSAAAVRGPWGGRWGAPRGAGVSPSPRPQSRAGAGRESQPSPVVVLGWKSCSVEAALVNGQWGLGTGQGRSDKGLTKK
ncbi:unnamed protein product [Rangifer tarandus platyrhynchus]|uniref:Uncharacterized protein n=1 Tax=Rangifer tarandus platyrhynchus TaxID=3082113 RepID=A0ABN8Z4W5_RANTA|nr:unnamed protein product [Rangifer tarandus platyrhynchus]